MSFLPASGNCQRSFYAAPVFYCSPWTYIGPPKDLYLTLVTGLFNYSTSLHFCKSKNMAARSDGSAMCYVRHLLYRALLTVPRGHKLVKPVNSGLASLTAS